MVRLIDILEELVDGIREDNPFGLVLKGGTALAIHHLPGHRESEDLDFDISIELRPRNSEIVGYLKERLEGLKADGMIEGFETPKAGFASTDRYHMTVLLQTQVRYQTKIDLNYRSMPQDFEKEGQLRFYTSERMFVDKLLTFASRGALKDFYDVSMLLDNVMVKSFSGPEKLAGLVDTVIVKCSDRGMVTLFKRELRATDLRFRHLKESGVEYFVTRSLRNLRRFRNELKRGAERPGAPHQ